MFDHVTNAIQPTAQGGVGVHIINGSDVGGLHWDPGLRRPYLEDGRIWVDVTKGWEARRDANGQLITNAQGEVQYKRIIETQLMTERVANGEPVLQVDNATVLSKEAWIRLDATVQQSVRSRMRFWADLRASSTYGGFDAMAYPLLERELVNDPGEAKMDMDGITEDGGNLQPVYALQGLPLPITYSDFWLSERFLATSRAAGRPANTQRAEMAGRRVGELIEKTAIGTTTSMTYGAAAAGSYLQTSKVYGALTHPAVITKTDMTTPNGSNPDSIMQDILEARDLAYAQNFFGPFIWYHSTDYDIYLDDDYVKGTSGRAAPTTTLRRRIEQIEGISAVRRLDYLPASGGAFRSFLIQMTSDVAQAINGLEPTLVQWDSKGGMQKNFKVMAIQVPWIKSAFVSGTDELSEKAGIVKCTTS